MSQKSYNQDADTSKSKEGKIGNRSFQCPKCLSDFTTLQNLHKHIAALHGKLKECPVATFLSF